LEVRYPHSLELDMKLVQRFLKDESGATAIEYALIAHSISVVIITDLGQVGSGVKVAFTKVAAGLNK
jgi:pilus assembly protein Flp/PilA